MSGFNITTTKKEDVSLKLKSQNLRNSKEQTKRLEQESKRMELRLNELKIAMSKEKEEREAQGGDGSRWKSGKTEGTLTTHAQDVLNKNLRRIEKSKSKSLKPRKITVLKDEKIVAPPKNAPQPGTMAYLANCDPYSAPKESARLKGPKCGQCERKVAAVNCQECGEDYCAGCFASFHLKGALRKHRSMPIQANGPRPSPRVSYEPRPPLQQVQNEIVTPQQRAMKEFERRQTTPRPAKTVVHQQTHQENGGSASSEERSHFTGPSLLDGTYNEEDSAASFQAALNQWRGEDTSQASAPTASSAQTAVTVRPYSPVRTPTVNVDYGTSTNPVRDPTPDIVFHSTMTYSEKLLLKKHRRCEIDALQTPRVDSYGQPTSGGQDYALSLPEDEERVDFRALYEAAVTPRSDSQTRTPTNIVEVTEVEPNSNTRGIEQVSQYEVLEESDPEVEAILLRNKKNEKNSKSKSASKSGRRTPADKSKLPPSGGGKGKLERENTGNRTSSNFERENTGTKSSVRLEREKTGNKDKIDRPSSRVKREKSDTYIKDARIAQQRGSVEKLEAEKTDISLKDSGRPPVVKKASAENGKLVNGRPPSRAKSKSGTSVQSRPQSRTKSRAQSRSGSRARPWSRADIPEGNLTKRPSEGLKAIASRTSEQVSPSPYMGLQDVLTIGVSREAAPQVDRVMTPSFDRPGSRAKSAKKGPTVSYKFYQMSPRSWKPQVSLGDQVDIQPSDLQDYDHAFAMAENEAPPMFEDEELEQEIKALAGITGPSPDVIRERSVVDQRLEEDLPPVPASPEVPLPSPVQTPVPTASPSMTPRPPQSPSNTPRRRSVRSVTPRKQVTPVATPTPRTPVEAPRPTSSMSELGRESRMIVVDGDDMTEFDDQDDDHEHQCEEDAETLDKLEWELASETGRITADGKISRMTLMNSSDDELARSDSFASSNLEDGIRTPRTGYEMDPRVSEEELNFDYEDIEQQVADEDEVRALR
ncbi:zinc finger B-box domain-containing protein 1-like [Lineus longissimus]|uniref:zinc finger B-box domain-containing protein 1-like n=1 Tax=Lineus longissimus TaxID=88925 RepID=UPI002B4E0846